MYLFIIFMYYTPMTIFLFVLLLYFYLLHLLYCAVFVLFIYFIVVFGDIIVLLLLYSCCCIFVIFVIDDDDDVTLSCCCCCGRCVWPCVCVLCVLLLPATTIFLLLLLHPPQFLLPYYCHFSCWNCLTPPASSTICCPTFYTHSPTLFPTAWQPRCRPGCAIYVWTVLIQFVANLVVAPRWLFTFVCSPRFVVVVVVVAFALLTLPVVVVAMPLCTILHTDVYYVAPFVWRRPRCCACCYTLTAPLPQAIALLPHFSWYQCRKGWVMTCSVLGSVYCDVAWRLLQPIYCAFWRCCGNVDLWLVGIYICIIDDDEGGNYCDIVFFVLFVVMMYYIIILFICVVICMWYFYIFLYFKLLLCGYFICREEEVHY